MRENILVFLLEISSVPGIFSCKYTFDFWLLGDMLILPTILL